MNNNIQKVTLKETCNNMSCEFSIIENNLIDILIVSFKGVYREGSLGSPDLGYLEGMTQLGVKVWHPFKVLIDIREVDYQWGDDMECLFYTTDNKPTVIVLGDKNRYAISTLLHGLYSEKDAVDNEFFFEDFDKALEKLKTLPLKNYDNEKGWFYPENS